VTFRNAEQLRDAARYVPLDRILVETDSPYLAPVPHRGKENQPAMTRDVAEYMAVLKGVSIDELARVTTENFHAVPYRPRPPAICLIHLFFLGS
jgi:TatD DNase family protein